MSTTITDLPLATNNLTDNDYMLVDVFNGSTYDSKKIIKSTILGYKVYSALLTQSGTDDPIVILLQNEIDNDITITRDSVGNYLISSNLSVFTEDKTFVLMGVADSINVTNQSIEYRINWQNDGMIYLNTLSKDANEDNCLYKTAIEIRVYN